MATITTTSATLNRLRAAAALVPIIQSGLADSKLSRDRANQMANFIEWAANSTPENDVEQRLVNELNAGLSSLKATSTTFSASKIVTLLDDLRAQILGGADAAYDTLLELQQALQNDQTGIAALTAAIDKRVRFDAAQILTAPEQLQARNNIGAVASTDIGDTSTDFVAIFEAQLIA